MRSDSPGDNPSLLGRNKGSFPIPDKLRAFGRGGAAQARTACRALPLSDKKRRCGMKPRAKPVGLIINQLLTMCEHGRARGAGLMEVTCSPVKPKGALHR